MEFYRSIGSPKYAIGPMVDQSELAYRELVGHYGVDLFYTPMFHAAMFLTDKRYRRQQLSYNFDGYAGSVFLISSHAFLSSHSLNCMPCLSLQSMLTNSQFRKKRRQKVM